MKTQFTRYTVSIMLLVFLAFGLSACAHRATTGERMYQRIPAKEHAEKFPDGHHGGLGDLCNYHEKADVYFCAY